MKVSIPKNNTNKLTYSVRPLGKPCEKTEMLILKDLAQVHVCLKRLKAIQLP